MSRVRLEGMFGRPRDWRRHGWDSNSSNPPQGILPISRFFAWEGSPAAPVTTTCRRIYHHDKKALRPPDDTKSHHYSKSRRIRRTRAEAIKMTCLTRTTFTVLLWYITALGCAKNPAFGPAPHVFPGFIPRRHWTTSPACGSAQKTA